MLAPALSAPPFTRAQAEAALADRAVGNLSLYIRLAWPVLEPGTPYLANWHIDALAEYLEAVSAGEVRRLLINLPPQNMKSTIVTICWPTWEWLTRPWMRWMFVSYAEDLSTDHSLARRTLIQSAWYQRHYGDRFRLAGDLNRKTAFQNDARGLMTATSIGGRATGKGVGRLVFDDPHNPKQAESDAERNTALREFNTTFPSRHNNKKTGVTVVVMQRLHHQDIAARCIELNYTTLILPAEAPVRTVITLPRSGTQIVREAGDLLWPEREGRAELDALKTDMGSYAYAGQYQQTPTPREGGLFKRHWWRFWCYAHTPLPAVPWQLDDGSWTESPCTPLPADLNYYLTSWDMSFKGLKDSDFVAGGVWAKTLQGPRRKDKYLLDQALGRWDFVQVLREMPKLAAKWPQARLHLVEDTANGPAVIRVLRSGQAGGVVAEGQEAPPVMSGIVPVTPHDSKYARAAASSAEVESGNVFLPHPALAPWVLDFIEQHAAFPNGANDDMVDHGTQGRAYLDRYTGVA